ncbi:phosphoglycolate phosphatase, TA0175-type [Paenibacillus sp. Soil766]|uniref:Cof-type HAD-IIB family hydrolase n=1 Tax=Paenibacillus sp. Soil766 TaxID=1736404 RepID=UPI00070A7B97|nr:Cof-type HAD-IIB family hydrolase [Paenibacillus sp. Soil766]KRF10260.1 phosphoglycolate phosphatase, TA0175-type [Paenibacillus sp. Soil766]
MTKYKLLALDMDGTLLRRDLTISAENRKWIHRAIESGISVMFATGREVQSIEPYIKELNLTSPMVSVNGSEVWEAPNVLMTRHLLEAKWVADLQALAEKMGCWYWAYTVDDVFTKDRWLEQVELKDEAQWLKFGFRSEHPDQLADILRILEATGQYELTNSSSSNIEVNPLGISKESGIREICQLRGIKMEEVVACGDSLNDLKMIRSVGLGIAMGNAQETVKQAAKAITGTNDEDGVAQVIRTYLLGER